ncbi:MetQ/NlpA family ABC transporter substrate-binding protein [Luteococcus sediminum]
MAVVLTLGLTLSACGGSSSADDPNKTEIRYGKAQGPYTVLFEEAIIPIMQKQGYTFTRTDFSDLVQNDMGLNEKNIDVNVEQHTAYMKNFNEKNGGALAALGPIPTVPAGIYSQTHTSLDQISDGAKIAVPNDAANTSRAYALLQKAGWIKLDPAKDVSTVTKSDIVSNPKKLQFTELLNTTIPTTLGDFDYGVITGSIVYNAKMDPSKALLQEDILPHLVLQVVVHEDNKDAKWAKDIVSAYNSQEFKDYLAKNNNGLWWIPEELR